MFLYLHMLCQISNALGSKFIVGTGLGARLGVGRKSRLAVVSMPAVKNDLGAILVPRPVARKN